MATNAEILALVQGLGPKIDEVVDDLRDAIAKIPTAQDEADRQAIADQLQAVSDRLEAAGAEFEDVEAPTEPVDSGFDSGFGGGTPSAPAGGGEPAPAGTDTVPSVPADGQETGGADGAGTPAQ